MDLTFFDVTKECILVHEIDLGALSGIAARKGNSANHDERALKEPSHHGLYCLLRTMFYLIRSKESTNFKRKNLNSYLVDFFYYLSLLWHFRMNSYLVDFFYYLSLLWHFRIHFLYICKIWLLENELLKKRWSKLVGEIQTFTLGELNFNIFKSVSRKIKFGAVLCQLCKCICLGNLSCFPGSFCLANCCSYLLKLMKNRNHESVINLLNWNCHCVLSCHENFV